MNEDWVKVYTSQFPYRAEIIKSLLEDNEIECVIMNKQDSSLLFGEIELYVERENIFKAKQLIESEKI